MRAELSGWPKEFLLGFGGNYFLVLGLSTVCKPITSPQKGSFEKNKC